MQIDTSGILSGIMRLLGFSGLVGMGLLSVGLAETPPAQGLAALTDQPWAVQFQMSNNFTLSAFQGTTISAKYHFNPRQAVRFGLSVDTARRTTDYENNQPICAYPVDDTPVTPEVACIAPPCCVSDESTAKRTAANTNLTGTMQYVRYTHPERRVTMFIAGGPLLGYERSSDKAEQESGAEDEYTRTLWKMGVVASLGVEWFVARNISLLAEYGMQVDYFRSKLHDDMWRDVPYEEKEHGVELLSLPVKFGVSVYF